MAADLRAETTAALDPCIYIRYNRKSVLENGRDRLRGPSLTKWWIFLMLEAIISAHMDNQISQNVGYRVSQPRYSVSHQMVTTAFELPGFRIVQNLGVVRGIIVRSRSIIANIGAGLQTLVGGNIKAWTRLCEDTRSDAFELMIQHASELGANAIVGARYDATEVMSGASEVLAYGTAVIVEPLAGTNIYDE